MGLRITTWNVNGMRNPFSYEPWRGTRTFESMFEILNSDIVIFQETKIQRKDLQDDMVHVPGWDCFFSLPRVKKGYSGVVIYTRIAVCAPIRAEEGITGILCPPNSSVSFRDLPGDKQIGGYPTPEQLGRMSSAVKDYTEIDSDSHQSFESKIDAATLDSEGRCVVLEFPAFVLIGVYCPAHRDESRDTFRLEFLNALDARVRNLVAMGKRVFLAGDINIAKAPIDSAHALEEIRKNATTAERYISTPSRILFNALLSDGVVIGKRDYGREHPVLHDICRSFHVGRAGMYTCWDTRLNTRPGNYGARIDYVLCSLDMRDWFSESNIQEGLMGSDHCPVYAVIKDKVQDGQRRIHILDLMNPPGMFIGGERQQKYTSQYILPGSGRLLPEFDLDKRRSIKDMFTRKPATTPSSSTPAQDSIEGSAEASIAKPATSPAPSPNKVSQSDYPSITRENSKPLPQKRLQSALSTTAKRPKLAASDHKIAGAGQRTLKGFFSPKATGGNPVPFPRESSAINTNLDRGSAASSTENNMTPNAVLVTASTPHVLESSKSKNHTDTASLSTQPSPSKTQHDTIVDPIVSKEDWTKLFSKKSIPLCDGHKEPCINLTTKKPGINHGRAFWICPRPLGPSGEKERGTQWRCPTFIWASDCN